MYTSSKPDHTQVHILPCTCTGVCEGRKLAVDKFREPSFCWTGSVKGPNTCHQLYTSKMMPPQPCVWHAEKRICARNDMLVCLTCPKCGTITDKDSVDSTGTRSCCAPDGAWAGKCGKDFEAEYTWTHGIKACQCNIALRMYISLMCMRVFLIR